MFGQLTVFDPTGRNHLKYRITQKFTYVGKDKDCDIRFESSNCAAKQFLLTALGNGLVKIQNLSKKFATQVNQKSIGFHVDHDLKEQDLIFVAGRKITWSYRVGAEVVLPQKGALKRTRNSEPVRQVAVVTPNRREMAMNEEDEMSHSIKRRKTVYESSSRPYTPHKCSSEVHLPGQSSFTRRISYDRMLKGKMTPSSRGRMPGTPATRMTRGLSTPSASAQSNKKLTFDSTLESPKLIYNHKAAFNKSITPRTFYSGQNADVPFTFRGFSSVAEESSSSFLPDDSYLSATDTHNHGRRSSRLSTPVPQKRLTSSFRSARKPGNRNALTGTPSAYFPTIEEGRVTADSYLLSYFSPTPTGSPRMMRAESPNIQNDGSGRRRSSDQARQSLVASGRSSPFGTPQEHFLQSREDSLFVNTSTSSRMRQSSSFADQSNFSSHNSNLQSSYSQGFNNTPVQLNTPRRSRSAIDTPGSTAFSPMSYNDTDYVLLSPRGRDLISKRHGRSDQSYADFSSPYSPSQNTLDFTASPPRHSGPRFAKTPKRSLSMQVLTKSIQKKANYEFNRSNVRSPKGQKSRRKSQVLSKRNSALLLASPTRDPSGHLPHDQPSIVEHSDTSLLDSDSEPPIRKITRLGLAEGRLSSRVSRRSQSIPSDSATRKSRKSELESEIESPRPCQRDILSSSVLLGSPSGQSGNPTQRHSSRKSRKSGNTDSQFGFPSSTPPLTNSGRKSKKSGMNGSKGNLGQMVSVQKSIVEQSNTLLDSDSETPIRKTTRRSLGEGNLSSSVSQRSQSIPSDSATRNSRKSVLESEIKSPIHSQRGTSSSLILLGSPRGQSRSPAMRNSSRKSRKDGNVASQSETPPLTSSGRQSRRSGMNVSEHDLEKVVSPNQSGDTKNLSRALQQSQTVHSGMPTELPSGRKSRKSGMGNVDSNLGSSVNHSITSHSPSQETSSRVSRPSQSVPAGTPTPSKKSRKSRTSGMGGDLESSVPSTSQNLNQGQENVSRVSRRSQSVPAGTPTLSSISRKSRKSGMDGDECDLESSVLPTPQNLNQGEENVSRVSRRSRSVPTGTLSPSSTSRKSRKSGMGADEGDLESSVLPSSQNLNQGEENVSRVPRQSRSGPTGTPTPSNTSRNPTNGGKRGVEGDLDSSVLPSSQNLDQGEENVSRVSRRSRSSLPGTPTRVTRKSVSSSPSYPLVNIIPSTPPRDITLARNSPPKPKVELTPKWSGSSTAEKCTPRNSIEKNKVKGIKPVHVENRTIAWPVAVPNNTSGTLQFTEDEKLIGIPDTRRSNRSGYTTTSQRERSSSTILDDSSSTSIANISAIPRSSRRTRVVFSTPAPSNSKKSVKVTSTPFPEGLISRRDGTQVSSDSTLPIEIDTVNIHSSYISSDSPDYDKITDEESFDLTEVPGTSAVTSPAKKTRKVSSKQSVSFVAIKSGVKNRKSLDKNFGSTSTPTEVQNSPTTSFSGRRTKSPTPRGSRSTSTSGTTTPTRTYSPEVVLRSSRKLSRRSMELSIPGTPTNGRKRNPRRSAKKPSPSAKILKKRLDSIKSPGGSAVKKLNLDPDKPDKKKMAALWICHKKKSPSKSPVLNEGRRSFEKPAMSPMKLNKTMPRNFKFQASCSDSPCSLEEIFSENALTPIKNLDIHPQQLSPEDDLLNALDLSRKSAIVVEPQKPSRRLRSSTQLRAAGASTSGTSGIRKASPKSPKKLLFRSPLVDYEGSQPREEGHFNSSNIKSILIPSPTRSSDEPMSRVFTTSSVVDYTDSSGKKKIFRASPTSRGGGIRELVPSEEMDFTGVRDLFEGTPSQTSTAPSRGTSEKRGRTKVVNEDVSPAKVAKVPPVASSRRKRGAIIELDSGSSKSTRSPSAPSSSKSPVSNDAEIPSPKPSAKPKGNSKKAMVKNTTTKTNMNSAPKASPKKEKKRKIVRLSVTAARETIKNKAVGRKQLKNKNNQKSKTSQKKQSSPKVEASPSKVSPQKSSSKKKGTNTKQSLEKESPKSLRFRKVEGSKKSPKKVSTPKDSKKSAMGAVKVVTPKKASGKEASPRKLRSKKGETKKSPKKESATSSVSNEAPRAAKVDASPKKRVLKKSVTQPSSSKKASTKNLQSPSAVVASTSKRAQKKAVPQQSSPKKASSKNVQSPSSVEAFTSKRAPKKAVTQRSSPKKASAKNVTSTRSGEASTSKESSKNVLPPKNTRKRVASPKSSPMSVSPKKLRTKNVEAPKAAAMNSSTSKATSKKVLPPKKPTASRKHKRNSSVEAAASKKTSIKVSPRKTRSNAKPKKQSPEKAGRKRR